MPDGGGARRDEGLFRAEALDASRTGWLGAVMVAPPIGQSLLVGIAVMLVAGVFALGAFGQYTRTARLVGSLVPEQGLIDVAAPQQGVVIRLHVAEGDAVAAGAPLAALSGERTSEALGALGGATVVRLEAAAASLRADLARHRHMGALDAATLDGRLAEMEAEADALAREIGLQRDRTALAERAAERLRDLRARAVVTEADLLAAERDALDQAVALERLEREAAALRRSVLEVAADRDALPLRIDTLVAQTERAIADVEQARAEAEAARAIVIAAPAAGIVTSLRTVPGASVAGGSPVLTLVPEGARLEARLYAPSRSIGFLQPGQRVRLRYDAFPHQRFGQHEGRVESISRGTIAWSDATGGAPPPAGFGPDEPVYRVDVALERQTVEAYGSPAPLQPGMRLEADILIETQPIWRWALDPLRARQSAGDPA